MSIRVVDLSISPAYPKNSEHLARLVRHLQERLKDLGPNGPSLSPCQESGRITALFPSYSSAELAENLAQRFGVLVQAAENEVIFNLSPDLPFEDLDYVWGCLFQLLTEKS